MPTRSAIAASDRSIALLLFIVMAVFNYSTMTVSTGMMESYHGRFHAAYVYQVVHGIVPPTNASAAGEPVNFYWPWHALIALVVKITNSAPFEVNAFVGSAALGLFCVALYRLGRGLRMTIGASIAIPLFSLGMYRLMATATQLFIACSYAAYFRDRTGISLDPQITSTADKFLNMSSFPTAFAAFAVAFQLDFLARWRGEARASPWCWVAALAMGLFSPIVLFGFDLWVGLMVATQLDWRAPRRQWWATLRDEASRYWPLVACNLLLAPYIVRTASLMGGSTSLRLESSALVADLVRMHETLWVFLVALPAGLFIHRSRVRSEPGSASKTRWLVWIAPIGVLLFPVIDLPDHNETKLLLLLAVPLGLTIVFALELWSEQKSRATRALVLIALLACGTSSILANAWHRVHKRAAQEDPWTFTGIATDRRRIDAATRDEQEMVEWVRAHTHPHDLLLSRLLRWDESTLPLLTQRRIVAANPSLHTERLPNHDALYRLNQVTLRRIRQTRRWIEPAGASHHEQLREIPGGQQAIYAVVGKRAAGRWAPHQSLVFQNDRYAVLAPVVESRSPRH